MKRAGLGLGPGPGSPVPGTPLLSQVVSTGSKRGLSAKVLSPGLECVYMTLTFRAVK